MHILVRKEHESANCTISRLYVDAKDTCLILQDGKRDVKVAGETRIPAGMYEVVLRDVGGFHERYLKKFGAEWHKGMLYLKNVPGFEFILIHIGNTPEDTRGCLLTGVTAVPSKNFISGSEVAYKKLYPIVRDHLLTGAKAYIELRYS